MLNQSVLDAAEELKLHGFMQRLRSQLSEPRHEERAFVERLMELLDAERLSRSDVRCHRLTRRSGMASSARLAELWWHIPRNLRRQTIQSLGTCDWVGSHQNVVITGPSGVGKTFLACALATEAAAQNFSVVCKDLPTLFDDLDKARKLGRIREARDALRRADLLVLDQWGLDSLTTAQSSELLTLLVRRERRASTMVVSPIPFDGWLARLGDPTIAEAIVDRIHGGCHFIEMKGDSVRHPADSATVDRKPTGT